jgi:hypothetical protein
MPEGMMLKSAGLSSTLYDPGSKFTLEQYCRDHAIPYQHMGLPVSLKTFSDYGLAFQRRFVPDVVDDQVMSIEGVPRGFKIDLRSGASFFSAKVIIAVGLSHFRNVPDILKSLPDGSYSHSSENRRVGRLSGRDVVVLGGGSSAIDLVVLMHEAGARARLITRRKYLDFNAEERWPRPLHERIRQPMTGVGPGWRNLVTTDVLPWIYPYLPDTYKLRTLRQTLGPAAGWFMRPRVVGVPMSFGQHLTAVQDVGGRVRLDLTGEDGAETIEVDHVVAATGYRTDVRRLQFLSSDLLSRIASVAEAPSLTAGFESSVPGLYFAGPISAPSAGPIMRFSLGAGFTARRISRSVRSTRPLSQAA